MAWSLMFVRTQWPSFFIQNVLIQLESMASQGCQCYLLCCNIAHLYALYLFFFLSFFYFFKFGYSCFTIMFVSAIQWSESAIYIYIYTFIPSLINLPPTRHPTPLCHHRALSFGPCTLQHVSTSNLFTHGSAHMSVLISQFLPPLTCHWVHRSISYVCVSIAALQKHSSIPFF